MARTKKREDQETINMAHSKKNRKESSGKAGAGTGPVSVSLPSFGRPFSDAQILLFERLKESLAGFNKGIAGIGTLSEKSVHAVLKSYYAPNEDALEVAINGFVADVCDGKEIFEIQTRHFYTMKRKLEAFLPEFDVTIVYPLPVSKTVVNIDSDTGAVLSRRKSPRKRGIYEIFYELYGIRDYIKDPHLHIRIVSMDVEEYRYQGLTEKHGRKIRVLSDVVPLHPISETDIFDTRDLMMFVPAELEEEFTVAEFAASAGISVDLTRYTLGLLTIAGVLEREKKGRGYIYRTSGP